MSLFSLDQDHDDWITLFRFEADYHRGGVVQIGTGECERCHAETVCLYMDGSQGEYGGTNLCQSCIGDLFDEWRKSQESNVK